MQMILLQASSVKADLFSDKCPDIEKCAKYLNQKFGEKYIFANDVKGSLKVVGDIEIDKDNYDFLFTRMLFENGFTRIPVNIKNTYQIVSRREAKDMTLPTLTCDDRHPPKLMNTYDLITMKYKAKNPEVVFEISRVLRNFMPPNSRIVSTDVGGMLIVTDSSSNMKKIYDMIVESDVKPTAEMKKRWEENEKRRMMNPRPPMSEGDHEPGKHSE